jgi:hypothetical protein
MAAERLEAIADERIRLWQAVDVSDARACVIEGNTFLDCRAIVGPGEDAQACLGSPGAAAPGTVRISMAPVFSWGSPLAIEPEPGITITMDFSGGPMVVRTKPRWWQLLAWIRAFRDLARMPVER